MYKDEMINNLHILYRRDLWVNELYKAIGAQMDAADGSVAEIDAQLYADTATWMLPIYEAQLGLDGAEKSLEDRRAAVEAAWKRGGKVDIHQIQAAVESWKRSEAVVDFVGGVIKIVFVGSYGVPSDLDGCKAAIRVIAPAHLMIEYNFKYLLIREVHNVKTIAEMQATPLAHFAHN